MESLLETMCQAVERHAAGRRTATPVPGLTLFKIDQPGVPAHTFYEPRLVMILRGSKTVSAGGAPFLAHTSTFLLVTVHLPVATQVFTAADGRSHVAVALDIDRALLADTLEHLPAGTRTSQPSAGVAAAPVTHDLLQPFARLLALLDHPADIPFVAPLALREIYYRVFRSPLGPLLSQLAATSSHLAQVSQAARWIREHYDGPMSIDMLADAAGMSVTSFHRHFKALMLMTPVQYRTQIRLQEARRRLIAQGRTGGAVAASVGYESQSQFTRDYKRMFGAPPMEDAARLAAAVGG